MKKETKQLSSQSTTDLAISMDVAEGANENVCPQCKHVNNVSDTYCGECGAALKEPAKCPKCGAIAHLHSDICETCGTWLLKGQCMFCYAHVWGDENYCGECGNPAGGITCPRCGKSSIFDFCSECGIPLSIQAKEMVLEAAQDPEFKETALLFEQVLSDDASSVDCETNSESSVAETADIKQLQDDQVLRLKSYRDSVHNQNQSEHPKKLASKALFSNDQRVCINQLNEEVAQEEEERHQEEERRRMEAEEKRRLEEERRRQAKKRFNEAMRTLRGKTFSSNQEARRFFMNMIAGLPEEFSLKIADNGLQWQCNCCDVIHSSPSECGDPSLGGVWLI